MALRALLQFQNPDSTRDMNDRSRVFNKGVFSGGNVTAGTNLVVELAPFAAVGTDGMFVREDSTTNFLTVVDGVRNFIFLRSKYVDNAAPVVSVESLPEATYLGDPDLEFLIVFAVVDVPLLAVQVTAGMIEFQEADFVDPLGRLELRGRLTNIGDLPTLASNMNRPGDFYVITSGTGDTPEMWAWNGVDWINVTQTQMLTTLLSEHIANLSNDAKHLTNQQFEAVLGTSGTPSIINRFVTQLDPRVPSQNENDAMTGDPTNLSGGLGPSVSNLYVLGSKVFASPEEKAFLGGNLIEIADADGPVYVGTDVVGTAERWFNIYDTDTTTDGRDKELINSQSRPVRVTGIYTEASFTLELNPGANVLVDSLGFFSGGSLFVEVSNKDVDGQADVDFRVAYGKKATMADILPQAFMQRGPQGGQVDSRVNQMLVTDNTPNFVDAEWDVAASPGDVVAWDNGGGTFVQHDTAALMYPIGLRGNDNNLIQNGEYIFPAPPGGFGVGAGAEVYADPLINGAITAIVNDRFIGTMVSSTKILVNMNAIALSATTVAPGVTFGPGFFASPAVPAPGSTVAWGKFGIWEAWSQLNIFHGPVPEGIRGNSDNIITNGLFVPGGSPYINQTRYFADEVTPGLLTTTINELFVGKAIGTDTLLVNVNGAQVWETARAQFQVEHDALTGLHDEGSARSWVGAEAGLAAASNSLASSTGMVYYASDTGRVWWCSNGAANVWIEQTRFTGPITVDNNLIASAQIRMAAKTLHDNVADSMNPFEHASRHFVGGADPLGGVVNMILNAGSDTPQTVAQTGAFPLPVTSVQSLAFDFTGRPGLSTIQIYAPIYISRGGDAVDISLALFLDTVEITNPNSIRAQEEINGAGEITITLVGFLNDVTAAAHTLEIRMGVEQNRPPDVEDRMIMVTDLGLT
jgi:hypothetical protein